MSFDNRQLLSFVVIICLMIELKEKLKTGTYGVQSLET